MERRSTTAFRSTDFVLILAHSLLLYTWISLAIKHWKVFKIFILGFLNDCLNDFRGRGWICVMGCVIGCRWRSKQLINTPTDHSSVIPKSWTNRLSIPKQFCKHPEMTKSLNKNFRINERTFKNWLKDLMPTSISKKHSNAGKNEDIHNRLLLWCRFFCHYRPCHLPRDCQNHIQDSKNQGQHRATWMTAVVPFRFLHASSC